MTFDAQGIRLADYKTPIDVVELFSVPSVPSVAELFFIVRI